MEFPLAPYDKELHWKAVGMGHNQDAAGLLFRERASDPGHDTSPPTDRQNCSGLVKGDPVLSVFLRCFVPFV